MGALGRAGLRVPHQGFMYGQTPNSAPAVFRKMIRADGATLAAVPLGGGGFTGWAETFSASMRSLFDGRAWGGLSIMGRAWVCIR